MRFVTPTPSKNSNNKLRIFILISYVIVINLIFFYSLIFIRSHSNFFKKL
ncbi:Uncharacterised protein [Acinetobacter baumannii]|uniref:Uncharacterized protein n=1 Tax=Acinetobacter baumannii TaxID=470 RepID=A0A0D5YLD6_ACIBA|nr:hypothetical protein ABUW_2994 [Acinetobacter baumannii]KZA54499.1 hypothetical protein LV47_01718 [Acinetobacter baumannii]KZA59391.1 hypothetical protein LV49_03001 [Acinetobacter baumannii]KZA90517.1 hypothetical protein LV58_02745 [Acinetobacter baumannii]SPC68811.1 hypothetical protein ACBK50_2707 [Acinetobacter baumannii]